MGWRYSFKELKEYIKLTLNYEVIKSFQEYENLATILSKMFGGDSKTKEKKPMTLSEIRQATARVNQKSRG